MDTKGELTRNTSLDLVKAIAIFGVVIIHNSGKGYFSAILSFDWISAVFIRCMVSASVPLFLCVAARCCLTRKRLFR